MKKLFISCPMRGRSDSAIRESMAQMHKIAEAVFGEDLEIVQTHIITNEPPQNADERLWSLGNAIQKMAEADYFIGVYDPEWRFDGCLVENMVASKYKIRTYLVNLNYVAPDIADKREAAKNCYGAGMMLL